MPGLAEPEIIEELDIEAIFQEATPWSVIVSNDPVNLINVVVGVFVKVLQIDPDTAMKYTMKVHEEGRCAVYWGEEEECKAKAEQLMAYNLWTHVEKTGN